MAVYLGNENVEVTFNGETIIVNSSEIGDLVFELFDHQCMKDVINSRRREWYERRTSKQKKDRR